MPFCSLLIVEINSVQGTQTDNPIQCSVACSAEYAAEIVCIASFTFCYRLLMRTDTGNLQIAFGARVS